MVTPLIYCTCITVWSAVTPSINSRKCCVYYIGNVSLTKYIECLPEQLISGKLLFLSEIFGEFLLKAMRITAFCHNFVSQ